MPVVRTATRAEPLYQALRQAVAERLSVGTRIEVWVPNRSVERWLQESLAEDLGILYNVSFVRVLPRLLAFLAESSTPVRNSSLAARISALWIRYGTDGKTDNNPAPRDIVETYLMRLPHREERVRFLIALAQSLHYFFQEEWAAFGNGEALAWQKDLAEQLEQEYDVHASLSRALSSGLSHSRHDKQVVRLIFAPPPLPKALDQWLSSALEHDNDWLAFLWTPSEAPWQSRDAHHLLEKWGRRGQTSLETYWHQMHAAGETLDLGSSRLAELQKNIRGNLPQSAVSSPKSEDTSIRLQAFATREEEVQSLVEALTRQAQAGSLRAGDVLVVVPELQRAEYLTSLHAAFEISGIPWMASGLAQHTASPWLDALQKIFSFPLAARVDRENVLAIVAHPAMGVDDRDADDFIRQVDAAGILFGSEQKELEDTYLADAHSTWDAGLRHIFSEQELDTEHVSLDGEVRNAALSVRLLFSMRDTFRSEKLAVLDWCTTLRVWTEIFLGKDIVRNVQATWESLLEYTAHAQPVSYDEIFPLWSLALERLSGFSRGTDSRGISITTAREGLVRPIQHVYCLGWSENAMRKSFARALDTAGTIAHAQEERDRYALLTLLMATRASFWMSYVARDELGNVVLPARIVEDLGYASGAPVSDTLRQNERQQSTPVAARKALDAPPRYPATETTNADDSVALHWAQLISFLQCPLQGSVRYHAGAWPGDELARYETEEALTLATQQRRRWLTDCLARYLAEPSAVVADGLPQLLRRTAVLLAQKNQFPRGALLEEIVAEVTPTFFSWSQSAARIQAKLLERKGFALHVGLASLPSTRIAIETSSLFLHGQIATLDGENGSELFAVAADRRQAFVSAKRLAEEQKIWSARETWLASAAHLALTATQKKATDRALTLFALDGRVTRTQLQAIDVSAAESWLAAMCRDLALVSPSYIAPLEAVLLWTAQLRKATRFDGEQAEKEYAKFHRVVAQSHHYGASGRGPYRRFAEAPSPTGVDLQYLLLTRYAPLWHVQGQTVDIPASRKID